MIDTEICSFPRKCSVFQLFSVFIFSVPNRLTHPEPPDAARHEAGRTAQKKRILRPEYPLPFPACAVFCCYEIFMLRLKLAMALLGIIDHAALADHIHLDLSGIFQFSFDLLGDIAGEQHHVGI